MTVAFQQPLAARRVSRRSVIIASAAVILVAALLYLEWRTVGSTVTSRDVEADTMCMASRIGLPCR